MTVFAFFPRIALFVMLACLFLTGCPAKQPVMDIPVAEFSPQADVTYQYLRFEAARRQNNTETALDALQRLLPLAPQEDLYVQAGAYQLELKDYPAARDNALRGLSVFPENYTLRRLLVESYLREQRIEEGLAELQAYAQAHPDNFEAEQDLILLLIQCRKFTEAEQLIKRIPDKERSHYLRYYHAAALNGLGRSSEAVIELIKAVREVPDFIEGWIELAYLYEGKGQYSEAEMAYERALSMAPDNQELWMRLVSVSLRLKNYPKALELALQGPQSPSFLLTCATLFMSEGLFPQAQEVLDVASDTPGMPEEVYFYQAVMAFDYHKDFPAAIAWLTRISPNSAYHERALMMKSQVQFADGNQDAALGALAEAIALYPENLEARISLIQMLVFAGRQEEALEHMQATRERWPDNPEVEYRWGSLLHALGRNEEALAVMEALIERAPAHADALNYIGYSLADENHNLDRALALVLQADALQPDSAHIVDSLAWVYYRLGELNKAWAAIQRSIKLGGDEPEIWEHYAAIADAMGKNAEASKARQRIQELSTIPLDEKEYTGTGNTAAETAPARGEGR